MKKSRLLKWALGLLAIFLLPSSCALLSFQRESVTKPSPTEEGSIIEKKTSELLIPRARTEEQVLGDAPQRVRDFLLILREKLLAGDLAWLVAQAEPAHRERFTQRWGMDEDSYLAVLMDLGGSFSRGASPLAPEPDGFDLGSVTAMAYLEIRRQDFSWIVGGFMTDRRGRAIDFSLDVLGELETILLTAP